MYCKVHWVNHGLDKTDIGAVYSIKDKKLHPIADFMEFVHRLDLVTIANVIDADNFDCWSYHDYIWELSTNLGIKKTMNFSDALESMKIGMKLARSGWNGKNMWVAIIDSSCIDKLDLDGFKMVNFFVMKTADDKLIPWLASQTDLLAEDWYSIKK